MGVSLVKSSSYPRFEQLALILLPEKASYQGSQYVFLPKFPLNKSWAWFTTANFALKKQHYLKSVPGKFGPGSLSNDRFSMVISCTNLESNLVRYTCHSALTHQA
jgi:hypothetical protein